MWRKFAWHRAAGTEKKSETASVDTPRCPEGPRLYFTRTCKPIRRLLRVDARVVCSRGTLRNENTRSPDSRQLQMNWLPQQPTHVSEISILSEAVTVGPGVYEDILSVSEQAGPAPQMDYIGMKRLSRVNAQKPSPLKDLMYSV